MNRKLYRCLTYDGDLLALVAATDERHVHTWCHGAGIIPHSVREVDINYDNGLDLMVVVRTDESRIRDDMGRPAKMRTVRR